MSSTKRKILLVITGSIAAYKSMDLVRLLTKNDYDVTCLLTKAAKEFITPLLCSSLSGNKTYSDLFSCDDEIEMGHINLSRNCDLVVVAPSSADFIAKLANGYADDLASTTLLASNKKIILAPAMNQKMWSNDVVQNNLAKIKQSSIKIINPITDTLACGEYGMGKMADVADIFTEIQQYFTHANLLKGCKILLTGGGTIEPIDPVRFIGNHSSGKQALAIATTLSDMGADVTFIASNINDEATLDQSNIINCRTADEMLKNVDDNIAKNDVFISCAAVSDYKVKSFSAQKIKKTQDNLQLELTKNPDILKHVGHHSKRPKLVIGFAAESENLEENAQAKLINKNCDFVIANDVNNGEIFGSNKTQVKIIGKESLEDLGAITKSQLAEFLGHLIAKNL